MVINIAASHRFHLLDLARELSRLGHDVRFYSYVPRRRCMKFGLDKKCCRSLLWLVAPLFALDKVLPCHDWLHKCRSLLLDNYLSYFMRRCDIYICIGYTYSKKSIIAAKKRFGAITILHWGSKYIVEQKKIMASLKGKEFTQSSYRSILEAYAAADYVAIPSMHVKNSFLKYNYPNGKLLVNPYGVDIKMFKPLPETEKKYDYIMVGNWCLRKGCDLIVEAIKKTKYNFLHVGSIDDLSFPIDGKMTHVDAVDQSSLINYYNQAKVFLFPSREDGFGMVLSQAVACNLPIVGSKDSGAPELKAMVEFPQFITLLEDYTVDSLLEAMEESMKNYNQLNGKAYAGNRISDLTWEAYGRRYQDNLAKIM